MSREPVLPTPRKGFTPRQRMEVYTAQKGMCEMCGKPLAPDFEVDHRIDIWFGGAHEPANWRALCKVPCHRDKTSSQAGVRAHNQRLIDNEKPETRKRSRREIRSAGFRKHPTLVRGLDHKVKLRTRKDHP